MKLRGGALRLYELIRAGGRVEIRRRWGEDVGAIESTANELLSGPDSFQGFMLQALREWYDGAGVQFTGRTRIGG